MINSGSFRHGVNYVIACVSGNCFHAVTPCLYLEGGGGIVYRFSDRQNATKLIIPSVLDKHFFHFLTVSF